ncbi:preQ(1) synthase [Aquitalea sp. S1-19]|nr:preQ(1) synthase [Aquitalea sp. S1-19]RQW26011.1 preQ(1) synthase [Rhodobacteraceae bacterium CH30]
MDLHTDLQSLGNKKTDYRYDEPDASLLERFPNPYAQSAINPNGVTGSLNITCPEFTSLCPVTGQPDFATIVIDMVPGDWCVESKSLKLYLGSFRMHGEFHESCICRICNDLVNLLKPRHIVVEGRFTPRGGIPLWPKAEWKSPA